MSNRAIDLFRGWNHPFRELARWQDDIDRMMQQSLVNGKQLDFAINFELEESKDAYMLKFEMPGFTKDQVKIELEGSQLTVSAERTEEKTSDSKKKHYSEFRYGNYVRSLTFPTPVNESKIDAKFENGVLNIVLPKAETAKTKQVKIQ